MADLNINSMTESEEMYLITIAHLGEMGQLEPIPLSRIAETLEVQAASANQMIRKLESEGLVQYTPYKGVRLEEDGKQWAQRVLRHRRLWEVFFVNHLNLPPDEADELACHMEHVTPEPVANQLSAFLDHPLHSPQGYLIPDATSKHELSMGKPLSVQHVGESITIKAIPQTSTLQAFLENEDIQIGKQLTITAIGHQGDILLESNGKHTHLSKIIADQILVQSPKDHS